MIRHIESVVNNARTASSAAESRVAAIGPSSSPGIEEGQRRRLQELEAKIRDGRLSYVCVGLALAEIHDQRLYRERFPKFEDYCREKWSDSARYSRRLIAAAQIYAGLKDAGFSVLPDTEAQAQKLFSFPPHERVAIWKAVVDEASEKGGAPISPKWIKRALNRRFPRPKQKDPSRPSRVKEALKLLEAMETNLNGSLGDQGAAMIAKIRAVLQRSSSRQRSKDSDTAGLDP